MDKRYTYRLEHCGYGKPCYVVRFCGEWVCHCDTKEQALEAISNHQYQRDLVLKGAAL